jgi:hypothetical protein
VKRERTRPSVPSMAMVRTVFSPEMLGDLEDKSSSLEVLDLEGVEDRGKIL